MNEEQHRHLHPKFRIFIGNIIHCTKPFVVHTIEKGFVIVRDKKIIAIDNVSALNETKECLHISDDDLETITLSISQLLIPGLIDGHIHGPQYPNAGLGLDMQLLEWLTTYTYPLEMKFREVHFAHKVYEAIVKRTLSYGTTTACYFGTVHLDSTLELCEAVLRHGQRALIGKVNMNRCCPIELSESDEDSLHNTEKFIKTVLSKQSDLVKPVISPRFALSCEMGLLKKLSELAKKHDLHIQSHISENHAEIRTVHEKFQKRYAHVYDEANLLTRKTVLAHGIHLEQDEMILLAKRGTSIIHCPNSNSCLQSGMCDVRTLIQHRINVGLGTDVSGGASPSVIDAMRCALQTSVHLSYNDSNHIPLNCYDAFYLATLGGAKALALSDVTGNFEVGKDFDALIIDMNAINSGVDYLHEYSPLELLQKFIYIGDDRNVVKVFVAGKQVK